MTAHHDDAVEMLRRDLQDGDDLALAMRLVGDALDRRLTRIRRSLAGVQAADEDVTAGMADRLAQRLEHHQATLDRQREQLSAAVEDLQATLASEADDLPSDHG